MLGGLGDTAYSFGSYTISGPDGIAIEAARNAYAAYTGSHFLTAVPSVTQRFSGPATASLGGGVTLTGPNTADFPGLAMALTAAASAATSSAATQTTEVVTPPPANLETFPVITITNHQPQPDQITPIPAAGAIYTNAGVITTPDVSSPTYQAAVQAITQAVGKQAASNALQPTVTPPAAADNSGLYVLLAVAAGLLLFMHKGGR